MSFFIPARDIYDDTWHMMKGRQVGYPWKEQLNEAQVVIIYVLYLLTEVAQGMEFIYTEWV